MLVATGRFAEAGYILRTFAHYVRDGLIPNLFPEGEQSGLYHTADASLWYFHALDRYLQATGDGATLRQVLPKLREIIEWKVERVIAVPPTQLRISRQKISSSVGTGERYLVSVARDDVIAQYESVFESIGWKAGLLLPRHVGEAQWLLLDGTPGDKLLVSANRSGFTSLITRDGEPLLIRSFVCDPSARGDELHRFAMYYRDRLSNNGVGQPPNLSRILVLGDFSLGEARRALFDALDTEPAIMTPNEFGFELAGEAISFEQLAGAAGLATLAWQ